MNEGGVVFYSASPKTENQNNFKVIYETENLLWGIIPGIYQIDMYDKLVLASYKSVGKISVKSYQTFAQKFLMFVSLGVYIPETLEFEFWGEYVLSQ